MASRHRSGSDCGDWLTPPTRSCELCLCPFTAPSQLPQNVLNRVNKFNGRVYREDPTILGWNLINEARHTCICPPLLM